MSKTERKTERAIIETTILRDGDRAIGVEFDVIGHEPFTLLLAQLGEGLLFEAACHGIKQKVGDAAAIARNPETGKAANPTDKHNAMLEVRNRLVGDQQWNANRTSDGTGGTRSLLALALERLMGKSPETIDKFLADKSAKEQAKMRADARIAPIIQAIKDERAAARGPAAKSTDVDAMFAELDSIE